MFPNLIFVCNDANGCRRIELNSRDIDVANSTTIYSAFLLFFWAPKSLQMVITAMKLKDTYALEEKL